MNKVIYTIIKYNIYCKYKTGYFSCWKRINGFDENGQI